MHSGANNVIDNIANNIFNHVANNIINNVATLQEKNFKIGTKLSCHIQFYDNFKNRIRFCYTLYNCRVYACRIPISIPDRGLMDRTYVNRRPISIHNRRKSAAFTPVVNEIGHRLTQVRFVRLWSDTNFVHNRIKHDTFTPVV